MKKYRKKDQKEIAKMIQEELTRALRMAMCDLDPKSPTMKIEIEKRIHNERRAKDKQKAIEQFFNELNSNYWNFFTGESICNNLFHQQTASNHNIHEAIHKNEKCCSSCLCNEKLQSKDKPIHDVKRDHNRTIPVNNDEIVIQIPKGLKISSIQIQFDSNNHPPVGQRFVDRF